MNYFSSKLSTWLVALLILLVSGQGFAAGSILCFQEDGRSAFERARDGQCGHVFSSCSETEELSWASGIHEECGSCQDVSAASDFLHGRSRGDRDFSAPAPLPAFLVASSPRVTIFVRDLTANLFQQPPPPQLALVILRTVVLRN